MLFSLLTLGIWSAWATVRNRRYLYGNTEFAGNRFDFHGNPMAILRGRILAVIFFAAYARGGDFYFVIPTMAVGLLIMLFPWILASAMRFRLSNTSWRNLRFDFGATTKTAYSLLSFPMLLIFIAYGLFFVLFKWVETDQSSIDGMRDGMRRLGIVILFFLAASFVLVPLAIHRTRDLVLNHTFYGAHCFKAELRLVRFLGFYIKSLLTAFVAFTLNYAVIFVILSVSGGIGAFFGAMAGGNLVGIATIYFFMIPAYLLPYAVWKVSTTNYVFGAVRFERLQFEADMKVWPYWWILVSNAYVAIVSLGLAIPWTKVRIIRYKLSCLSARGEMQVYHGKNVGKQTATGDEIGDAFDIDFGF